MYFTNSGLILHYFPLYLCCYSCLDADVFPSSSRIFLFLFFLLAINFEPWGSWDLFLTFSFNFFFPSPFLISDRLVECGALKRAIEIVYTATLPKASKPFIYMSIKLPTEHVDVNIHPTKREVHLILAI